LTNIDLLLNSKEHTRNKSEQDIILNSDLETELSSKSSNNSENLSFSLETEKSNKLNKSNLNNKTHVLNEIFSSINNLLTESINKNTDFNSNYDNEDNGYKEIHDTVTSYKDKQKSSSINLSNIGSGTSNNLLENRLTNTKSNTRSNMRSSIIATEPSYNINSALNNGKVYKINL
jgi:hypothetical protein